jgi:UDP-GlcNAc:undecaprenyl-phosphate GlcNAc-1-phosphate transferase
MLFVIAAVNAYNFIDGIDGLAAGSAFIACVFLSVVAWTLGHGPLSLVFLAVAGGTLGFLQFNFPPSRLFMGDGGSTFLGYFFAYATIAGNRLEPALPAFIPVLILSSLYLDAGLTVIKRLFKRERLFQPHRTHYYQRLLQIGFNHKQVTLLEYLVTILLGASALVYVEAGEWFAPFVTAAWVVAFTLAILKIRGLERGGRMFWERRVVLLIAVDMAAIVAAYLGAYFLRMNFQLTEAEGKAVLRALPIVLVVRSACFFKYGLYRTMWRYTSVADVVRVIKAVTTGSAIVLAIVVLLYRFVAFPRTLFVIEYVLLILFILGARFSIRLFHEIGREPQGTSARRYAVIGAGDAGERLARAINAHGPSRRVVCFVDDDAARVGLMVHGVPVEGPADRLADICARHRVDSLVYAMTAAGEEAALRWVAEARRAGVPIERAPDAGEPEPDAVVLERVAQLHGRKLREPSTRAHTALRGGRVLVTHGGERAGHAIVAALRSVGAVPVVHFDNTRADGDEPRDLAHYVGSLRLCADDIVARAAPDAVIHAVTVEPSRADNEDDRAWSHVVCETESLARAVWRTRSGCPLVVAAFWGSARPGTSAALTAAAMESIVLNRAGAEPTSVVRWPRVLTAAALRQSVARDARPRFDVLETEVAALLLELAAGGFRGIYTLAPGPEVDLARAQRALAANPRNEAVARNAEASFASALLFAHEHADECGVDGVQRVLGPLFPASGPFRDLALHGPIDASPAERGAWVASVEAQLVTAPTEARVRG